MVGDLLTEKGENCMLTRAAWLDGVFGIKSVSLFPGNPQLSPPVPSIQGVCVLHDGATGMVLAVLDGSALTAWKTAGDSALGSRLLSRQSSAVLTMVGAGGMAGPLVRAHLAARPTLQRVIIWNRTRERAEALAQKLTDTGREIEVSGDLEAAVSQGDVVSCATMANEPIVKGAWLKPGAHLDLVGAFTLEMREADDEAIAKGRLFVDARDTTVHEIGELMTPIAAGTISESDILGDLFDLAGGTQGRRSADEITVYKNGGGAHLDLMTARAVNMAWQAREEVA